MAEDWVTKHVDRCCDAQTMQAQMQTHRDAAICFQARASFVQLAPRSHRCKVDPCVVLQASPKAQGWHEMDPNTPSPVPRTAVHALRARGCNAVHAASKQFQIAPQNADGSSPITPCSHRPAGQKAGRRKNTLRAHHTHTNRVCARRIRPASPRPWLSLRPCLLCVLS